MTLALLFLIQATRFIKFVKQVFQQQQTSSSEPRNRWHLIDRGIVSRGRGEGRRGNIVKKQSNESHKGVPLYVSTSLLPLYHPLSYPQGKAIHPCPLLLTRQPSTKKKKKKKKLGYLCAGALRSDLGCSPPCGSL